MKKKSTLWQTKKENESRHLDKQLKKKDCCCAGVNGHRLLLLLLFGDTLSKEPPLRHFQHRTKKQTSDKGVSLPTFKINHQIKELYTMCPFVLHSKNQDFPMKRKNQLKKIWRNITLPTPYKSNMNGISYQKKWKFKYVFKKNVMSKYLSYFLAKPFE